MCGWCRYTKQGTVKYQADCAPNGYYLIPVYDRGDYELRVEPPAGWGFQPTSVPIHIDGSSDPCSKGQDVNFVFHGFSITGKVVNRGQQEGPAGVDVKLMSEEGKVLGQATTGHQGHYSFPNIRPGSYRLVASHPRWRLDQTEARVTVATDNAKVSSLTVGGFDVQGHVVSEGEPIQGVHFLLFAHSKPAQPIPDCDPQVPKGFKMESQSLTYLCHVSSKEGGKFLLPAVPPGDFVLVPFYKGEHTAFEVSPPKYDLMVGSGSVNLPTKFQVQGFSVSGRVLRKSQGPGVGGAQIYLDGREQATTDEQGLYHLENMRAGSYKLEVKKPHLGFEPATVKITPNAPNLPDMVASTINVCGQISLEQPFTASPRNVEMTKDSTTKVQVAVDATGSFCQPLAPGTYTVRPLVSSAEAKDGLRFSPEKKTITLDTTPILDLKFEQLFATISGRVQCLQDCGSLELHLAGPQKKQVIETGSGATRTFTVPKVLPGKYEVVLQDSNRLCWKARSQSLQITDSNVDNLVFEQTGFRAEIHVSHATTLKLHSASMSQTKDYAPGKSEFCLPAPGKYSVTPMGCHKFPQDSYTLDTSSSLDLSLTAIQHRLSGTIVSADNVSDIAVILSAEGSTETLLVPQSVSKAGSDYLYKFQFWVNPNTVVDVVPNSRTLLFQPRTSRHHTQDDCMLDTVSFRAQAGLFIKGKITPAIEGVNITVKDSHTNAVTVEVQSGPDGKFTIGPLDGDLHYQVDAIKEGYILTAVPDTTGHFNAFKLAEVAVQVVGERNEPLGGVLMSLSGGTDYRKNSVTQPDGKLSFHSLSPGQYFLRAVMKEYHFNPPSTMVEVKEGALVPVTIKGKRVAYSCYGMTNSLTREPEPGITVEAIGVGNCSQYQEEAISETDGSFRIRGLIPYCQYLLRTVPGSNQQVERSVPPQLLLQVTNGDLTDQRLIIMRKITQMDVTGNIISAPEHLGSLKVTNSSFIFYSTHAHQAFHFTLQFLSYLILMVEFARWQVKLYRGEDNLIHTASMSTSTFFQMPSLPIDNSTYSLVVDGGSIATTIFRADRPVRHFLLKHSPTLRHTDPELAQGSMMALPLVLIAAVLIYSIKPLIQMVGRTAASTTSSTDAPAERSARRKPKRIN
ncbi:hypothetical protein LAZ67_22001818 [Cordylochernes scorpioides]|uniref:Nodal modulator 2 n=1 Tax=Cordylochernes scorpioides TaxID=51811 RepID=A0ABY6LSB0_9ARAC|nr:hypothetical protein LAZ67_22001818 [Cordylochernes scorpioides]